MLCRVGGLPGAPVLLLTDNPVADARGDRFGFREHALVLCRAVAATSELPLTVGVYGAWGSGKSSFVNLCGEIFRADGVPTVAFNPWKYDERGDVWHALIQTVLQECAARLEAESTVSERRRARIAAALGRIAALSKAAAWLVMRQAAGVLSSGLVSGEDADRLLAAWTQGDTEAYQHVNAFEAEFREVVDTLTDGGRLVVLIDDLDRCTPAAAVTVLDSLKLFFGEASCVFVLAMDHAMISEAVASKLGCELPRARHYLEKLIQFPYHLPAVRFASLHASLHRDVAGLGNDPALWELIKVALGANPRRVRRFINALNMAIETLRLRDPDHPPTRYRQLQTALLLALRTQHPDVFARTVESPGYLEDLVSRAPQSDLPVELDDPEGVRRLLRRPFRAGRASTSRPLPTRRPSASSTTAWWPSSWTTSPGGSNMSEQHNAGTPEGGSEPRTIIGLDIGDGESTLAYVSVAGGDPTARPAVYQRKVTGERSIVTAMAKDPETGRRLLGEEAVLTGEAVQFSVNFKEPPRPNRLETPDEVLFAQSLLEEYLTDSGLPGEDCVVYVGHPTGWPAASTTAYAKHFGALGMEVRLMPESHSALVHVRDRRAAGHPWYDRVLVIDIGSSTTDCTLVEDMTPHNIGLGADLGCRLIDRELAAMVRSGLKSPGFAAALGHSRGPSMLLLACRRVKEAKFSGTEPALLAFGTVQDERLDPIVDGAFGWLDGVGIMDVVTAPGGWAERFRALLGQVRDEVGAARAPELVVLSGGGSRMPFYGTSPGRSSPARPWRTIRSRRTPSRAGWPAPGGTASTSPDSVRRPPRSPAIPRSRRRSGRRSTRCSPRSSHGSPNSPRRIRRPRRSGLPGSRRSRAGPRASTWRAKSPGSPRR